MVGVQMNGYENIDRNMFFSGDIKIRRHEAIAAKKQCRLDIRKFSFSQRTDYLLFVWVLLVLICLKIKSAYTSEGRDTLG